MEKLKSFLNSYFWLIVVFILLITGIFTFLIASLLEQSNFEKTISNQSVEAKKAVQEANNANTNAANSDIERRTEDVMREKTITPKLDSARRKSQNSSRELEKARKSYNEKKNNTDHLSNSDADNCRELLSLFPDIRFEDCQ